MLRCISNHALIFWYDELFLRKHNTITASSKPSKLHSLKKSLVQDHTRTKFYGKSLSFFKNKRCVKIRPPHYLFILCSLCKKQYS